ncbi:YqgE/AlgH family protein [Photobacterium japonica]|uniref:YqgE/AlgH family protein n=1 Tax=Photobacterium japonica TaxID=2910235 RepID=UPI003D0D244A
MASFLTDCIIVANPAIGDVPKFKPIANRLVYIVEHNKDGAVGVSLNNNYIKPFNEIADVLPVLKAVDPAALLNDKLFGGGPLFTDRAWILGKNKTKYSETLGNDHLALNFSLQAFAENLPEHLSSCGIGTFGWGAGQLEKELGAQLWHYFPAEQEFLSAIPLEGSYKGAVDILLQMKG